MDSKRLTDAELAAKIARLEHDKPKLIIWADEDERTLRVYKELLLLRADAAELAQVMNDSAYADCDCDEPHCMKARELLSRPSVVNLLKEKD